jgi:imidazolonepropionase
VVQRILIKNIKKLVQLRDAQTSKICGKEMDTLPCMDDAWLAIDNGLIADYGSMSEFPGIADWKDLQVIDAEGKMVFPSWVDSHTHLVYAGSREQEFTDRIKGLSYEEIAQRGGGILNSAKKLHNASEEELLQQALPRLHEIILQGTGAVEIKSGYGLSLESELKMLRVIKKIKEQTKLTVKSTFLGAHAVPQAYKQNKRGYIDLIINEMIPAVAEEKLAEFIDIFCEQNYFSFDETIEILEAGSKHGLTPKVHAEQMSHTGGVEAGVKCKAISVDHLEFVNDADIKLLSNSITMPTILPGAAYFISLPNPPARQMIDAGLPLAIASDFNPGTSPTGNMNLMQSIACIQYKLTPNEAINASTLNSAYAMHVEKELGSITIGKKANLFITKAIPSTDFISYSFGSNLVETVILNGEVYKG